MTAQTTPAPSVTNSAKLKRSLAWALLWVLLDGFVFASLMCATACVVYVVFYALPRALIALKNPERRNYYLMRAAVFGLVFLLSVAVFNAQLAVGEHNGQTVVAAVNQYQADNKQYPPTLAALNPKYLPQIPSAKYALTSADFLYLAGAKPTLVYTTLPPFGRRIYDFSQQRWSGVD